jgi:hypothetical protein
MVAPSLFDGQPIQYERTRRIGPCFRRDDAEIYSAACCATVGSVPATVARRMSRGCDWS